MTVQAASSASGSAMACGRPTLATLVGARLYSGPWLGALAELELGGTQRPGPVPTALRSIRQERSVSGPQHPMRPRSRRVAPPDRTMPDDPPLAANAAPCGKRVGIRCPARRHRPPAGPQTTRAGRMPCWSAQTPQHHAIATGRAQADHCPARSNTHGHRYPAYRGT
jgi:hypothetical protein